MTAKFTDYIACVLGLISSRFLDSADTSVTVAGKSYSTANRTLTLVGTTKGPGSDVGQFQHARLHVDLL